MNYLPLNPQDNVCFNFNNNLSTRIIEKDYFKPTLPCVSVSEHGNLPMESFMNRNNSNKIKLRKINNESLSVAFDEAKRLDHVNLLLKVFEIKEEVKKTIEVDLDNIPKNLLKMKILQKEII